MNSKEVSIIIVIMTILKCFKGIKYFSLKITKISHVTFFFLFLFLWTRKQKALKS